MDFFNTILLSVICIMFPLLLYLIYLTYLNAKNENLKYEEVVFELALITGLFLTIELTKGVRTNYSIVLLNIPILKIRIKRRNRTVKSRRHHPLQ